MDDVELRDDMMRRWDRFLGRAMLQDREHAFFKEVVLHYTAPRRAYHNLRHIQACLTEFEEVRDRCEMPNAVEGAIWFHDLVYEPTHSGNEERSATEAYKSLYNMRSEGWFGDRVAGLI